jgi:hypothetical protein
VREYRIDKANAMFKTTIVRVLMLTCAAAMIRRVVSENNMKME